MSEIADQIKKLVDDNEIRSLVLNYASAVDKRDDVRLTGLFLDDGAITGPGFEFRGVAEIAKIPPHLNKTCDRTYHIVLNHLITIEDDVAMGEVYSQAHHLKRQKDGRIFDTIMMITYTDQYTRCANKWRFRHRQLDVRWIQTLCVDQNDTIGTGS